MRKLLFLPLALTSGLTVAAEEYAVQVTASWEAEGEIYRTSPTRITFTGALNGFAFIDQPDRSAETGTFHCPIIARFDAAGGGSQSLGDCAIDLGPDRGMIFGEWRCEGAEPGVCEGAIDIVGGIGPQTGVSGRGAFHMRSEIGDVAIDSIGEEAAPAAQGVAMIRDLRLSYPDAGTEGDRSDSN